MSKRNDIMLAIKALCAAALPDAKISGFDGDTAKPQRVTTGGSVIGHPGSPGEPTVDLNPLTYHYEHDFDLEVAAADGSVDTSGDIDTMLAAIGAAVVADRFLGGLVDFLDVTAADEDDVAVTGGASIRWAEISITAHYAVTNPLG